MLFVPFIITESRNKSFSDPGDSLLASRLYLDTLSTNEKARRTPFMVSWSNQNGDSDPVLELTSVLTPKFDE